MGVSDLEDLEACGYIGQSPCVFRLLFWDSDKCLNRIGLFGVAEF